MLKYIKIYSKYSKILLNVSILNVSNITNDKPQNFTELLGVKEDDEIVKELQDRNQSNRRTDSENKQNHRNL